LCGETLNFDQNEILPCVKSSSITADVNNIILKAISGNAKTLKSEVSSFKVGNLYF